ncbi:MAG: zinc ribbon domain-containing protein [Verrucomicrobiota bacterium]
MEENGLKDFMAENEPTKVCPLCAETIKAAAKVCPHCRYWQKKWSLYNPKVLTALCLVVMAAYFAGISIFMDRVFGPKEQFAIYRDEITVVNSQFSQRISVSGCDSNVNVYVTVVGTLTNRSNITWKDVGVEALFLDKSGKQFDAITVNANEYRGVTILPHGEAAFKIEGRAARPESDYGTYKAIVRWAKDVNQVF